MIRIDFERSDRSVVKDIILPSYKVEFLNKNNEVETHYTSGIASV